MTDRVVPMKFERASAGGSSTDQRPTPASVNQDGLEARAFFVQNDSSRDTSAGITRDSGNNLQLFDPLAGSVNLSALVAVSSGVLRSRVEDFEGTIFPPVGGWSSPGDLLPLGSNTVNWARSVTNPISGTASARVPDGTPNGGTGDGALSNNTKSHLQFDLYSPVWFRLSFKYQVVSESTFDFLKFFIEKTLVTQWTGGTNASPLSGTYTTNWLPPGHHRFVWAVLTDTSTQAVGQRFLIDDVTVSYDDSNYQLPGFVDHFAGNVNSSAWSESTSGTSQNAVQEAEDGVYRFSVTNAGGTSSKFLKTYFGISRGRQGLWEARLKLNQLANSRYEFGVINNAQTNWASLIYDSSAATYWRYSVKDGTTENVSLSSVAANTSGWVRLTMELDKSAVRFYLDRVLIGTATTNLPDISAILAPYIKLSGLAAAAAPSVDVDIISWRPVLAFNEEATP